MRTIVHEFLYMNLIRRGLIILIHRGTSFFDLFEFAIFLVIFDMSEHLCFALGFVARIAKACFCQRISNIMFDASFLDIFDMFELERAKYKKHIMFDIL